jgi:outer membrane protein OmpA-like peptidoglycan-associated protein
MIKNEKPSNLFSSVASFAAIYLLLLSACVSQKKLNEIAVLQKENEALKGKLDTEIVNNKNLLQEKAKLKSIDSLSEAKSINYLDSINIATNKDFDAVAQAQSRDKLALSQSLNITIKRNYDNVKILSEILNLNTFTRFKAGAIFGQGQYNISDELWKTAFNTFVPIMDSIITFVAKHPNKKFNASIAILGFSDATAIDNTGPLYADLIKRLNKTETSNAALNLMLSQLRAEAVAKVFDDISVLKFCKSGLYNNLALTIYPIGRGEELPDPSLKGAEANDERRRAVIAYWSLLPQ